MRRLQVAAVIVHTVLFLYCLITAFSATSDALYQAVWFPLFWVDLPATLVMILTWVAFPDSTGKTLEAATAALFASHPLTSFWNFWYPAVVYGIVGTTWWYFVPRLFGLVASRLRRRQNAL
jgi:hypothetical protein